MRYISGKALLIVAMSIVSNWIVQNGLSAGVLAAPGYTGKEVIELIVRIHHRQFIPDVFHLTAGQSTRLTLINEDAELHAFVPMDLFVNMNVQVGGNGAPQFDKEGFRRVLIPSGGHVILAFIPKIIGSYSFFCDLPGHIMNGTILVESVEHMLQ